VDSLGYVVCSLVYRVQKSNVLTQSVLKAKNIVSVRGRKLLAVYVAIRELVESDCCACLTIERSVLCLCDNDTSSSSSS